MFSSPSPECSRGEHDACTRLFYDQSGCFGSITVCSCVCCDHEGEKQRARERRERLNAVAIETGHPELVTPFRENWFV